MIDIVELRLLGRDLLFSKTPRKGRLILEAAEEIVRLREELKAAQMRSIEARNPGINTDDVRSKFKEMKTSNGQPC